MPATRRAISITFLQGCKRIFTIPYISSEGITLITHMRSLLFRQQDGVNSVVKSRVF